MKLKAALFLSLCSIALHVYMTLHYYELALGLGIGESFCHISETFSCDASSSSSFAVLMGIPIAAWGAAANAILTLFIFGWTAGLFENTERTSRIAHITSLGIACVSVVMGFISVSVLKSYCPTCWGLYVLSFLTFFLIHSSLPKSSTKYSTHIFAIFKDSKSYLYMLLLVPVVAFGLHWSASAKYQRLLSPQVLKDVMFDWRNAPKIQLDDSAMLTKGAPRAQAKMVMTEFADFLCPHCKFAAKSFELFLKTRPDIHFQFYPFPLDPRCNEALSGQPGSGVRCYLSGLVMCSEESTQSGWKVHDVIFEHQQALIPKVSIKEAQDFLEPHLKALDLNTDELNNCASSEQTTAALKTFSQQGKNANVQGTPTVLVNGQRLSRAQILPLLDKVYREVHQSN